MGFDLKKNSSEAVCAIFDSRANIERAVDELKAPGGRNSNISVLMHDEPDRRQGVWILRLFFLLLFTILFSCGKGTGDSVTGIQSQQTFEGTYSGPFIPLNTAMVWDPRGVAKLTLVEDELHIVVAIRDITEAKHRQALHLSKSCPGQDDDKNSDGFLDIQELYGSIGKELIPLDDDPETHDYGEGIYQSANYRYDRRIFYSRLLKDLRRPDDDVNDEVIKLKKKNLKLSDLVVIVYGIPDTFDLPKTVKTWRWMTPQESLPIACAQLRLQSSVPSEPDVSNPEPERNETISVPEPLPPPVAGPEKVPSWRSRIGAAWRSVWCRIRRNCGG